MQESSPGCRQALQWLQRTQAVLALVAQQVWSQALQSILVQHAHCAMPLGQINALLQANPASGSRRWKEETHVAAELFCLPSRRVCAQPHSSAESHLVACPTAARGGKEMPLGLCSPGDLHPLWDTSLSNSSSEVTCVQAQWTVLTTQEEELQVHSSSCNQAMRNTGTTCATKDHGVSASSSGLQLSASQHFWMGVSWKTQHFCVRSQENLLVFPGKCPKHSHPANHASY